MDIKIEAPGHKNQDQLIEFYSQKLNDKYATYPFIKSIDVKVQEEHGQTEVSLQFKPEKAKMLFVNAQDRNENKAFQEAIRKMNILIEKYKQKRYHSVHTIDKPEIQ